MRPSFCLPRTLRRLALCLGLLTAACSSDSDEADLAAEPWGMKAPIITVIDDDTLTPESVTRFHDVCRTNGIIGTYACIASRGVHDPSIFTLLHQYEAEGFHITTHCYDQQEFYRTESRDAAKVIADLELAKEIFEAEGFQDMAYFVAPYGSRDKGLQDIVRNRGYRCLISNAIPEIMDNHGRQNRYAIPRFGLNATDDPQRKMSRLKELIDRTARSNGWLLVGTHIYSGWTDELLDTRFREFVNYAKSKGLRFVTLKEGFAHYEPVFEHYNQ